MLSNGIPGERYPGSVLDRVGGHMVLELQDEIIQKLMNGLVIETQERSRAKNITLVLNIAPEIGAVADTEL